MLAMRVDNKLMVILEPENIDRIKAGRPLVVPLATLAPELAFDVAIGYTPDAAWVKDEALAGKSMVKALEESMTRPEVRERQYHETMTFDDLKI